ncbi:MAG: hypothetical protein LBE79_01915, partial [Tannerella sp.]|nr:hypothetical protein [Tannerella sp.]
MLRNNKIHIVAGILLCIQFSLSAQNSTVSPYTRYGYGVLADQSFGAGRSMGGIGYGLRSSIQINPVNPASYTSMDSLTFLFDVGATLQMSWLNDATSSHRNINGNLMYLAMQFPLSKTLAMSAGVLPFSHTGYKFNIENKNDAISHTDTYSGKGGLNEVYVGLSYDIWKKRLSLGANVSYLFGMIEHNSQVSAESQLGNLYAMKKVTLQSFKYNFGMQYTHPVSKTERMTFGFTYSPKLKLKSISYDLVSSDSYFMSSLIQADTVRNQGFDVAGKIGFGASYVK